MDILVVLVQILKAIIELGIGLFLFRQWRSHNPRFMTDLPFIYGLVISMVGLGESVDVLIDSGLLQSILMVQKFRLSFVIISVTIMFFSLFQIGTPKKTAVKYIGTGLFGGSWALLHMLGTSREIVYSITAFYFVLLIVPYFITFYLVYRYNRLPDLDARFILLSTIILFVGQVFKTWFLVMGILWISEAIDLVGWTMIFLSFNVPRSKTGPGKMKAPIAAPERLEKPTLI